MLRFAPVGQCTSSCCARFPGNERFGLGPFFRIEPLGMEYIAAALEARGHTVDASRTCGSAARSSATCVARRPARGRASPACTRSRPTTCWRWRARSGSWRRAFRSSSAATPPPPIPSRSSAADVDAVVLDDGERVVPDDRRRGRGEQPLRSVAGMAVAADGRRRAFARRRARTRSTLDDVPLPARRLVDALAPAVRLPRASPDLAGRDGARLSVPLLVLLDLAAACALGARALDRLGVRGSCQRAATTSSSPTICSGITRRAAGRWPTSCGAAASARSGSWCRAASTWSRGTPICSRRGGRSPGTSTSSSASRRRPTKG